MFELYYNFSSISWITHKFKEKEMYTNSVHLALAEKNSLSVSEKKESSSVKCYAAKTVMIRPLWTLLAIFRSDVVR